MSNSTSLIFYDGPSQLNGDPIIGVATLHSNNRKTGSMVQTYILCKDIDPVNARRTNRDVSICGECPLRQHNICYVLLHQAPLVIFKSMHKLGVLKPHLLYNKQVRVGAYGDPTAIPLSVWKYTLSKALESVGYTHQWRKFLDYKDLCQASVDTEAEAIEAQAAGWHTYRISNTDVIRPNEYKCTYPTLQCNSCMLCNGKQRNIVQTVHGSYHPTKFKGYIDALL